MGIYVTIFDKHDYLINLFKRYGFHSAGVKKSDNGSENVLLKNDNLQVIWKKIILILIRIIINIY